MTTIKRVEPCSRNGRRRQFGTSYRLRCRATPRSFSLFFILGLLGAFCRGTHGFLSITLCHNHWKPTHNNVMTSQRTMTRKNRSWRSQNKDHDGPGNSPQGPTEGGFLEDKKKKFSVSRAGGRASKRQKETPSSRNNRLPSWLAPAAFGLLFLGWFFGGDGVADNYYYYSYQSSIEETRLYDNDGKMETSRKESGSFKSNIPGLESKGQFKNRDSDAELETYMDSLVREAMRDPLSLLDDWVD